MFYDPGCYGRVALGALPEVVQQRLAALPGEWLEFEPAAGAIVVRYVQPSSAPCLPAITSELVRMLGEIPAEAQDVIAGGDLFVHTESGGQLVRLRVGAGGALEIRWAHPDYSAAQPQPFTGKVEPLVDPHVQRLAGRVTFAAADPPAAARAIEALADAYEGLYPEGVCSAVSDATRGTVQVEMRDLNLDVLLLVERLRQLARPGSLSGNVDVSSFAAADPEHQIRFLFDGGRVWVQRPLLWRDADADPRDEEAATCSTTA